MDDDFDRRMELRRQRREQMRLDTEKWVNPLQKKKKNTSKHMSKKKQNTCKHTQTPSWTRTFRCKWHLVHKEVNAHWKSNKHCERKKNVLHQILFRAPKFSPWWLQRCSALWLRTNRAVWVHFQADQRWVVGEQPLTLINHSFHSWEALSVLCTFTLLNSF